ncbi:MAG: YtxH domain-containing protein [Bryobacteraceae bacterium]|nr:YtxH domain-containing protein [Bryobacteraceae bacterium]
MRDDTSNSLLWFAAGLSLGTVIGLMTAPQSGAETRRLIGSRADDARRHLASNSREYIDRGRELYERGKQLAEEASQMFDEGRHLMEQADAAEASAATSETGA